MQTVNTARLDDLMGRYVNDFGAAMQAPLMILGEKLGLYAQLASDRLTTTELAARTGTAERYVREWARGQAAAGYVSYDPATERYFLDPEQALLMDAASPTIGGFEVALAAGQAAPRLLEAFRTGAGIGWHEHAEGVACGTARFYGTGYRTHLLSDWLPALTGIEARLREGGRVADVGCGHGVSTRLVAEAFPSSTCVGFDYHAESVDIATREARDADLATRLEFIRARADDFPGDDYDLIMMFDCLHDLGDPVGAARHVRQALAADGTWLLVEPRAGDRVEENLHPLGRAFYAASTLVCTPNALSQAPRVALGAQAGEAAIREVAEQAGFTRFRRAAETPFNLVFEIRP